MPRDMLPPPMYLHNSIMSGVMLTVMVRDFCVGCFLGRAMVGSSV